MRMRTLAVFVALLFTCAIAVHAVTWGEPDGIRHPHVGTLLFLASDGGLYSCTGTLLSPSVMVTAGHCTSTDGVPNLRTWVTFNPTAALPSPLHRRPAVRPPRYTPPRAPLCHFHLRGGILASRTCAPG